jgi:hypothetical protein
MRKVWKYVHAEGDPQRLVAALQAIEGKMGGTVFAILARDEFIAELGHFGGLRRGWDVIYYVEDRNE